MRLRDWFIAGAGFAALIGGLMVAAPPRAVEAQTPAVSARGAAVTGPSHLVGGPRGAVRTTAGQPVEGIMVQLISGRSAVRTTVYTNEHGAYEFPRLDTGDYTLRLARPLEYRSYRREGVRIDGATT